MKYYIYVLKMSQPYKLALKDFHNRLKKNKMQSDNTVLTDIW